MAGHTLYMTKGNITGQLITVAWPLVLCDIIQQMYNTVDSYILSRYVGQTAFAALGVAETYLNLMTFILLGACTGISVILATHFGGGDRLMFRRGLFLAAVGGTGATLFFAAIALAGTNPALTLINTPPELMAGAGVYLQIVAVGLVFCYIYNLSAATLRAVGNTQVAAVILTGSLIVKSVLSYCFVVVFGYAIAGAAVSTVLTQFLACLAFYAYARAYLPELLFTRRDMVWDRGEIRKIFNYSSMTALQQSSIQIGKVLIQGSINGLGAAAIAAYAAAARIESFVNTISQSIAAALSVFVAQNLGADDKRRAMAGVKISQRISGSIGLVIVALLYGFAPLGIGIFVDPAEGSALAAGVGYLRTVSLFYLICFVGAMFQGYFRGAGLLDVQYYGTTMQIAARVVLTWLLIDSFSLEAVAWATGAGWILITIYQLAYFYRHDMFRYW